MVMYRVSRRMTEHGLSLTVEETKPTILLIQIGETMVLTNSTAKYVGWWASSSRFTTAQTKRQLVCLRFAMGLSWERKSRVDGPRISSKTCGRDSIESTVTITYASYSADTGLFSVTCAQSGAHGRQMHYGKNVMDAACHTCLSAESGSVIAITLEWTDVKYLWTP